ncbi:Uncharacterised protein [Alistipes finegoldii]|nr:Uncharacterised protein [Alistipes finegoldii]
MKQCYTLTGLDVLGKIRSYIRFLTVILLYVTFALPASAQGGGKPSRVSLKTTREIHS